MLNEWLAKILECFEKSNPGFIQGNDKDIIHKLDSLEKDSNYFNNVANRVVTLTKQNKDIDVKTFDPFTIWMIIQIIYQIIKCYLNKKKTPEEAILMVRSPGFIEKVLLRRIVNKAIRDKGRKIGSETSQSAFKSELYESLLKIGKTGTLADLERLQLDMPEVERMLNVS